MSSRGESSFAALPSFAAGLYNRLTQAKAFGDYYREIAQELVTKISKGRVLDIGTGPGKLLREIYKLNPDIELFGLDISNAMVQLAKRNLVGIRADLRCGNIGHTSYESNFFDVITCSGSFYVWDHPKDGLEEIYRILKEGQSAYLFETHKDFDRDKVQKALRNNLLNENLVRRLISPFFLKKQLDMTYRINEIVEIVEHTSFAKYYSIEEIILGKMPIWLRIKLAKK